MAPPGYAAIERTNCASIMNQKLPQRSASGGGGCQSLFSQLSRAGLSGEEEFGPLRAGFRKADGFAGEGFGAAGIGVAEKNAVHGMGGEEAVLRVVTGHGHEHGMAAAVDAHFHGIDLEFRHQILEIGEDT